MLPELHIAIAETHAYHAIREKLRTDALYSVPLVFKSRPQSQNISLAITIHTVICYSFPSKSSSINVTLLGKLGNLLG